MVVLKIMEEEVGETVEVPQVAAAIEQKRSYRWIIWVILAIVLIVIGIVIFVLISVAEPATTGGIVVVDSTTGG